jgi:hypothetical protein
MIEDQTGPCCGVRSICNIAFISAFAVNSFSSSVPTDIHCLPWVLIGGAPARTPNDRE